MKGFNDAIHGYINIDPLLIRVIDTRQFQRLRHIKQLGACYWVYPTACHNRFEHSIGTCHLAQLLIQSLREKLHADSHLGVEISDKDAFCVSLAALCHDLGHGPFSHMFDGRFLSKYPEYARRHEEMSVEMLKHLVEKNDLMKIFKQRFPDFDDNDLIFVSEMIRGPDETGEYKGRTDKKKRFLYDIVSNKHSGVDVDKFDYIARDSFYLGIDSSFDHTRFIQYAKVVKVQNENESESFQICTREKAARDMYALFYSRAELFERAYHHQTNKVIDIMLSEVLDLSVKHLKFRKQSDLEKTYNILEATNDIEVFEQLTDNIFDRIKYYDDPNNSDMNRAKELLMRIDERKLFKFVAEIRGDLADKQSLLDDIMSRSSIKIDKKKIIIDRMKIDYGKGQENPINFLYFYKKSCPDRGVRMYREDISNLLPVSYCDRKLRIYYEDDDKAIIDELSAIIDDFKRNGLPTSLS